MFIKGRNFIVNFDKVEVVKIKSKLNYNDSEKDIKFYIEFHYSDNYTIYSLYVIDRKTTVALVRADKDVEVIDKVEQFITDQFIHAMNNTLGVINLEEFKENIKEGIENIIKNYIK